MSITPCRLNVYLACSAPLAVVLRRGPSEWCRLSLWHTDTDSFEHGQWFHGRIYQRRCDVSPDGSLFVYFAHKSTGINDLDTDSWAAISRPPWFSALAVWGVGSTYFSGGFFKDDCNLILGGIDAPADKGVLPKRFSLTTDIPYVDKSNDWTNRTVYVNRLLRHNWTPAGSIVDPLSRWKKHGPDKLQTLVMEPFVDKATSFVLEPSRMLYTLKVESDAIPLGAFDWLDWDIQGRLVGSRNGCLVSWDGVAERLIEDFNHQTPDPQPAPNSAYYWPR